MDKQNYRVVLGQTYWFEYHCLEDKASQDSELWALSHQQVDVVSLVERGNGNNEQERASDGCPAVFRVRFHNGTEKDVFEDELMETKEQFYRPDPPDSMSKTNWFTKTANRRGEYWYTHGNLIDADSTTGDGHAEIAIEHATDELLDLLGIPGDHQGGLYNYVKDICKKFQWEPTIGNEELLFKLVDILTNDGIQSDEAKEMIIAAAGGGDPRLWLLNKGYILIRRNDFWVATINAQTLRDMYHAAQLTIGETEEPSEVQEENDHFINIGAHDTGQYYMGVPPETLANGNPYLLKTYLSTDSAQRRPVFASKKLSSMSNDELIQQAFNNIDVAAIMQEAIRRKNFTLMNGLAWADAVVNHPDHLGTLLKYVAQLNGDEKDGLLTVILDHNSPIFRAALMKHHALLSSLASSSAQCAAVILMAESTPNHVTDNIIARNNLTEPGKSLFVSEWPGQMDNLQQHPILVALMSNLHDGDQWKNPHTLNAICAPRIAKNSSDVFTTAVSKFDMSADSIDAYKQATTKSGKWINTKIFENIKKNVTSGMQEHNAMLGVYGIDSTPANYNRAMELIEKVANEPHAPALFNKMFSILEAKMLTDHQLCDKVFDDSPDFLYNLMRKDENMCRRIFNLVTTLIAKDHGFGHNYAINEMVNIALNQYNMVDEVKKIPTDILDLFAMTPQNREKLTQAPTATPTNRRKMRKFLSNTQHMKTTDHTNIDWTSHEASNENLWKNIGYTATGAMGGALIIAVAWLLAGLSPKDAAEKTHTSEKAVMEAYNDPTIRNKAMQYQTEIVSPQRRQLDVNAYADAMMKALHNELAQSFDSYLNDLRRYEQLRLKPYKDSTGHTTIGWGHKIRNAAEARKYRKGISKQEADALFLQDAQFAWNAAEQILKKYPVDPKAKPIIANMAYQMGTNGIQHFHNCINALAMKNYEQASNSMLNSVWAIQTPGRASELANRMKEIAKNPSVPLGTFKKLVDNPSSVDPSLYRIPHQPNKSVLP